MENSYLYKIAHYTCEVGGRCVAATEPFSPLLRSEKVTFKTSLRFLAFIKVNF